MNLNSNPTAGQLRELISKCDDSAGHHILWVKKNGVVQLTRVPGDQTPDEFLEAQQDMQMSCETFLAGNEYVGPEAADDDEWVSELFDRLLKEWPKAKGKPKVAYLEKF